MSSKTCKKCGLITNVREGTPPPIKCPGCNTEYRINYRAIEILLPESIIALLEAIKRPDLTLVAAVQEIIYKECYAFLNAQKAKDVAEAAKPVEGVIVKPEEKKP